MKIKVCHVSSAHPDHDVRILLKESVSLAQAGFDVSLVVPSDRAFHTHQGVKIIGIKRYRRPARFLLGSTRAAMAALKTKSSIYHFHDPELLPFALLFKLLGKRVIFDSHEDVAATITTKEWIPFPLRKIVSVSYNVFEKTVVRLIDAVVGATPHITAQFSSVARRAVTVNNYPFLDEFYSPLESQTRGREFCYVGGINDIRGVVEMTEAAIKANVVLKVAGSGPKTDLDYLKSKKENIRFVGQLSRKDLAQVLQESFCGVVLFHPVPNHLYAQPNKLFEYMSVGLPVICSNFPLWRSLIEDNNFGLCVDPLDVDKIAEKMQELLADPSKAEVMGKNARRAIVEKYNWETEQKHLVQLYKELSL